jgi:TRAP-type transport system small permease protein
MKGEKIMQENPVMVPEAKKEKVIEVSPAVKVGRALQGSVRFIDKYLSHLGAIAVLALALLCSFDALGRYLFNSPIYGAAEYSKLLQGGGAFLCLAYALEKGAHISVDILYNRFPPRMQVICSFIALIVSLGIFAIILWQSSLIMVKEWEIGKLIQIILIPLAPFKLLLVFGSLLFCLEAIIQIVHLAPKLSQKGVK